MTKWQNVFYSKGKTKENYNLDANEMVYIADSLETFFVKEDGIDIFNNVW